MKYFYKVYDKNWKFKYEISNDINSWNISFSERINGWQGQLKIELAENKENEINIICTDIIEIRFFDEQKKEFWILYTGIVNNIIKKIKKMWSKIEIDLRSISTLLNNFYLRKWKHPFKNDDDDYNYDKPERWIKQFKKWERFTRDEWFETMLTSFQLNYDFSNPETENLKPWIFEVDYQKEKNLTFSIDWVDFYNAEILNKISQNSDYYFFVDADWKIKIARWRNYQDWDKLKILTLWTDIVEININTNKNKLCNSYTIRSWSYDYPTDAENQDSINLYWLFEDNWNSDWWEQTITEQAQNYIDNYSYELEKIEIITIPFENWNFLKPWEYIKINNLDFEQNIFQIEEIQKSSKQWKIYINRNKNLYNLLKTAVTYWQDLWYYIEKIKQYIPI